MQLYFIRHGQSENNQLWVQTGSSEGRSEDPDLTETGRKQAQRLAEFLAAPGVSQAGLPPKYDGHDVYGFQLSHLYCSPMIRAIETGWVIARAVGLPLVTWVDLHEVGGIHQPDPETGERLGLPGKRRSYFTEKYPELVLPDTLRDDGWWNRPYETREERPSRARRFLTELLARHGDSQDRVAVVSHGGFYNHVMRAILELPPGISPWFSINNTAITRIGFEEEQIWISYTNRVDFLPPELIT
jgi:2,3-bisphosphoglycerate-dependent phosphoglycerate mutase